MRKLQLYVLFVAMGWYILYVNSADAMSVLVQLSLLPAQNSFLHLLCIEEGDHICQQQHQISIYKITSSESIKSSKPLWASILVKDYVT